MRFILTTDEGSFVSVSAETMNKIVEYLVVSGNLLLYVENEQFEDKVLETMIKVNIEAYNDLYAQLNKKLTKNKKSDTIKIEEDIKDEVIETVQNDNVIQFPFGKKE